MPTAATAIRLLLPSEPARLAPRPAFMLEDGRFDLDAIARHAEADAHDNQARAAVLDCLRCRDLGGDWLGHPSFETGAHSDDTRDALIRDGLARWDDTGIHITSRGRRAWAEHRAALSDLASAIRSLP